MEEVRILVENFREEGGEVMSLVEIGGMEREIGDGGSGEGRWGFGGCGGGG